MNEPAKKKRGRPVGAKAENPASEKLPMVRVTPEQLKAYRQASEHSQQSFSAWVRNTLDKEAQK